MISDLEMHDFPGCCGIGVIYDIRANKKDFEDAIAEAMAQKAPSLRSRRNNRITQRQPRYVEYGIRSDGTFGGLGEPIQSPPRREHFYPRYGVLMYTHTVRAGKEHIKIAKSLGFRQVEKFKNPKTGNTVVVLMKVLDIKKPIKELEDLVQ
jgi:hypothetical protein